MRLNDTEKLVLKNRCMTRRYRAYTKLSRKFFSEERCAYRTKLGIENGLAADADSIPMSEPYYCRGKEYVFVFENIKMYFHFSWRYVHFIDGYTVPRCAEIDSIYLGRECFEERKLKFGNVHCGVFNICDLTDILSEKPLSRIKLKEWIEEHSERKVL